MSETDHPAFGIPWAADGETRPARFRTPLAYAPGHNGGVLFVRHGRSSTGDHWMTMCAWNAWVAEVEAAPVKPEAPDEPWQDEPE
jgi:poly(3-hydroxybutyrate) depolymerase